MGWYIRKRIGRGPVSLNLSTRGVGISAGVPGARVGLDASGRPYAHTGTGGLYYRAMGRPLVRRPGHFSMWIGLATAFFLLAVLARACGL